MSLQAPGGMAVMWACPSPRLGRVNSPDTRRQLEGAESPSHSGHDDRALSELLTTCNNTFLTVFLLLTTCNNTFVTVYLCSPPANNTFLTVFLCSPPLTKHFQQCFFAHHLLQYIFNSVSLLTTCNNTYLTVFLFSPSATIYFLQCFFSHHYQQCILNNVSVSRQEPVASACLSSTRQWREISNVRISSLGPLL